MPSIMTDSALFSFLDLQKDVMVIFNNLVDTLNILSTSFVLLNFIRFLAFNQIE
uniref:Uncharacterized protein n=1 Tax=Rhizophora mucronata TaxID=61149 RepID=A0A2P2QS75_RHIMU